MGKLYGAFQSAFDAAAENEPTVKFSSGFDKIDDLLLEGKLRLGEIVEICGERDTAKLYVSIVF
jgi:hypothetical protein